MSAQRRVKLFSNGSQPGRADPAREQAAVQLIRAFAGRPTELLRHPGTRSFPSGLAQSEYAVFSA